MKHTINIYADGDGYIAEVEWYPYMYAFGYSEEEARKELYEVLSMLKDYYNEQANLARSIIETPEYAV
jgi:predicted RNase H-like HicB family nuclease